LITQNPKGTDVKLNKLMINPAAIENGERITDLPECGDLVIITKGINNAAYRRMFDAQLRAVPKADRKHGLTPEVRQKIQTSCVVETCTQGWENLVDENDQPIPFSKELLREYAADPRREPLINACILAATWVGDDIAEETETTAKN
jgi:hypothetical protein